MATIFGTNGNDLLVGTDDDDLIQGLKGRDSLRGRDDDDTLDGGKGKDNLTGGDDEDVFRFVDRSGKDVITDFEVGDDDDRGDRISLASRERDDGDDDDRGDRKDRSNDRRDDRDDRRDDRKDDRRDDRGDDRDDRFSFAARADDDDDHDVIQILAAGIDDFGDLVIFNNAGGDAVVQWDVDGRTQQVTLLGVSAGELDSSHFIFG